MERTKLSRIGKTAMAIGFSLVIGAIAVTPARADHHDHHHGGRHHEAHYAYGHGYVAPAPSYYYAPPANYYTAPEPTYYYNPQPVYNEPPPPSEGVSLFFGIP
jgi:hypothetical protein